MTEILRSRQKTMAPGATNPAMLADKNAQRALAEVHAQLEELYQRVSGLGNTTTETASEYDDTALQRKVKFILAELEALQRRVAALERMFPIVRYVRVKVDRPDYLECVFYRPANDTEGAAVNIAKPYALRRTPFDGETVAGLDGANYGYVYTSNWERTVTVDDAESTESLTPYYFEDEVLAVVRTPSAMTDLDNKVIVWEDANFAGRDWGGGGGGLKIYYAEDEDAVRDITPSEPFAFGYGTSDLILLGWESGTWHRVMRFKAPT